MNAKGHHSKLIDEIPDPTGKSDKDFIEVIKEIEDKIIQLKNSL